MRRLALSLVAAAFVALAPAAGATGPVITVGNCRLVPGSQCQGAFLVSAQFPGVDLHGINLAGANLQSVNFAGANLTGADLARTDLRHANLSAAKLAGANLTNANLNQATLKGANLEGADLKGAMAQNVILNSADARNARFNSAQMHLVAMAGADARGANFEGSVLYAADLQALNAQGANLSRAILSRSLLQGADLGGANLQGADMVDAVYEKTRLTGAATGGATIWPSNLKSDVPALEAFYERIQADINGDICNEQKPREVAWLCFGASASGGTLGFNAGKASFRFDEQGELGGPTIEVNGTDDVRLLGPTSANFGAFWPEHVRGPNVFPLARNVGIGAGEPGGPLAVNIEKYSHWVNISRVRGYRFKMKGWLRRR